MRWAAAALVVVVGVTAGCGDDGELDDARDAIDALDAPPEAGPTTAPPADAADWEGQHYDFGTMTAAVRGDDGDLITFDRMEVVGDDGVVRSGPTLTEEPIVFGNSDAPFVNDNPRVRTFLVSPDVVIKRLTPMWTCTADGPAAPSWDPVPFDELVANGVGADTQNSLTFDDEGHVIQIRLSRGC